METTTTYLAKNPIGSGQTLGTYAAETIEAATAMAVADLGIPAHKLWVVVAPAATEAAKARNAASYSGKSHAQARRDMLRKMHRNDTPNYWLSEEDSDRDAY